jgi:hypothetical protein
MGVKFSHKLEVFLPWMLLNRNFLKENRYCPRAGWENFCAKIFPKLLLGQCTYSTVRDEVFLDQQRDIVVVFWAI